MPDDAAGTDIDSIEEWYARLAGVTFAVGALITDGAGAVLLARPTYKTQWIFVGGTVDADEPPLAAMRRELIEELGPVLGARISIGRLLVSDWISPKVGWDRPMNHLVFDCGRITADDLLIAELPLRELAGVDFVASSSLDLRMADYEARRTHHALMALRDGSHVFLQDGHVPGQPRRQEHSYVNEGSHGAISD